MAVMVRKTAQRLASRSPTGLCAAIAACLLAFLADAPGAVGRPFTDVAGRQVEVPDKVSRVLAAGPPASVLLYTLAPAKMVGWVAAPSPAEKPFLAPSVRDLPAYGRLTGRGGTANVESVLVAKPDLIVDSGSTGPTFASLADRVQAQTGIPYILLDGSLAQMPEAYRQLGALLGLDGAPLAAEAQRRIDEVAAIVATVPEGERPRIYYGRGPRGLETGLGGSINTEILDAAGGRNVAAAAGGGGLATVSPEQILAWDPDIILTVDETVQAGFRGDPLWRGLKAVREGRVYRAPRLPFGWFDAPPGVNRLIGLRWLAGLIHPTRFPQPIEDSARAFYRRFYHVELTEAQLTEILAQPGPPPAGKP